MLSSSSSCRLLDTRTELEGISMLPGIAGGGPGATGFCGIVEASGVFLCLEEALEGGGSIRLALAETSGEVDCKIFSRFVVSTLEEAVVLPWAATVVAEASAGCDRCSAWTEIRRCILRSLSGFSV